MSYFSEVAMDLAEERGQKHTLPSGPNFGSDGYLVTYDLTTDKSIEMKEILVKGDIFDALKQAKQFLGNPNIDCIYVYDKKTGEFLQTILEPETVN